MNRKKVIITPTTHWDREWVMTFGQFQVRLVNLVGNLTDILDKHPDYLFMFDGQAIVLEDYLEIMPEQREKLCTYLKDKRIITGPWYILSDQFLENAESMVRNLIIGMKTIRQLGGEPMMLGYVPDSFGSIATLPMILDGFGIKYATFGRGRPKWGDELPSNEFIWKAKDGSEVTASNMGYGNGLFLSYLDIWTDITKPASFNPDPDAVMRAFMQSVKNQENSAASPITYFSVGCDHMEPRASLPRIVDYINSHQDEYELVFGTPYDYLQAVESETARLKEYSGEMRGSDENPMDLAGTLSSRMPLKQINDCCEILLQRAVEPLWAMVSILVKKQYPMGHINKMWRLLISNHAHDSICGCHIDQVCRDIMNRYEQIRNICQYLIKDGMHILTENIDTGFLPEDNITLTVVNPLGHSYSGPVRATVRVPRRFDFRNYVLTDTDGNIIPIQIKHIANKNKDLESVYMTNGMLSSVISKNADSGGNASDIYTVLDVDFMVNDLPGIGYKTFYLKPETKQMQAEPLVKLCENGMENNLLKVIFNKDGTVNMQDKTTGRNYCGLNYFADREDIGDTYDSHGFEAPQEFDSRKLEYDSHGFDWKVYETLPHKITYRAEVSFELPEAVADNKRSDSMKTMQMTLSATLYAELPRLDMTVELDNICSDHILRAVFDTGLKSDKIFAYDHFNIIERKVGDKSKEWKDEPFQEFVDVSDGLHGLCISAKGLPAYQAVDDGGVRLYLTLLRSVGQIGPAAGANYPVPDAQCRGYHKFEYSIMPHEGNWVKGDCLQKALNYRSRILVEADIPHKGCLPPTCSFISVNAGDAKPFISCLKQAEDKNGLILRLWNPGNNQKINLNSDFEIKNITPTNLDESTKEPGSANSDVSLKANGVGTVRIEI